MVRISENQQFSDFLSFSREIPVPFSTVSKFSEVEVERSESALGKLVPTKQRIVYSFIGSYTRGRWGGGGGGAKKFLKPPSPFLLFFSSSSSSSSFTFLYFVTPFHEKGTPFVYLLLTNGTYTSFRTLHPF